MARGIVGTIEAGSPAPQPARHTSEQSDAVHTEANGESAAVTGGLAIIAAFGLTILGATFKLPEWALSIGPLHHVPNITASPNWTGLARRRPVFAVLNAVAFTGFRRRDIA